MTGFERYSTPFYCQMCSHDSVQISLIAYRSQTIYIHQQSLTIVTIINTVVNGNAIRTAVHPFIDASNKYAI